MNTKLKIALGGTAVAGCGAAGGATAHEYGYPKYFSFNEGEAKNNSTWSLVEIIEEMKSSENKKMFFSEECKIWIHKKPSSEEKNNLTDEWRRKISNLTGFFRRSNVNSFWEKCKKKSGMTKIDLEWNANLKGWEVTTEKELFS